MKQKHLSAYDQMQHLLGAVMISADRLWSKIEQKNFVNQQFTWLYESYECSRINKDEYNKLVKQLAAYAECAYSYYLDTLVESAEMMPPLDPEIARSRRKLLDGFESEEGKS